MFRIGHGYDCHAFIDGDHLMLGGIKIPFEKGIKAHSDGDVLLHAIGDALLGAAALGDLGSHFPDNDPSFKHISSQILLEKIQILLQEKNYRVINIDSTIITEMPKLKSYITPMQQQLAKILNISPGCISIKAKTNEKMGWIGKGEGLAAHAVVLIDVL